MRTLFNLVTILFVIGSGYYLVVHNESFKEYINTYSKDAKAEFHNLAGYIPKSFDDLHLGDLSSLSKLTGDLGSTTTKPEPIATSTLPGPLKKITPSSVSVSKAPTQPTGTTAPVPVKENGGGLTVSGIIAETNKQRIGQNEKTLAESTKLDASAEVKAKDILARQYFEHTAPDGKTVSDLVSTQGYQYIKVGENLALGNFGGDTGVVTAWMNSPGHRANILDAAYTEMGVGVAYGMYEGHMVSVAVQHFGRPLSACPLVEPGLKAQVEKDQADLSALAASLDVLKKEIDQGRANGQNMDSSVTVYNQGVEKYQKQLTVVESLRQKYNSEVSAFNSCAA